MMYKSERFNTPTVNTELALVFSFFAELDCDSLRKTLRKTWQQQAIFKEQIHSPLNRVTIF